jgi:hypothetical protein
LSQTLLFIQLRMNATMQARSDVNKRQRNKTLESMIFDTAYRAYDEHLLPNS